MSEDLVEWLKIQMGATAGGPQFLRTLAALLPEGEALRDIADRLESSEEATRRIVELHDGPHECPGPPDSWGYRTTYGTDCPTLLALTLPYADRPGYREEWRP